jgi:hypothetical protein
MANQNKVGETEQQRGSQGGQQTQGGSGSQSTYWRQQFQQEPYYQQGRQFEDYETAYQLGEQGRAQYGGSGQSFEDAEQNLRSDYEQRTQGRQNVIGWDQGGSQASRAAWDRAGLQTGSDRDIQSQGSQTQGSQSDLSGRQRGR